MGQMRPCQVLGFPGQVRAFLECSTFLDFHGHSDPMVGRTVTQEAWSHQGPSLPLRLSGLRLSPEPVYPPPQYVSLLSVQSNLVTKSPLSAGFV